MSQFLAMTCLHHKALKIGLAVVALLALTGLAWAQGQYPPSPDRYKMVSINTEA
jgi:hypothetical protein